MGQLPRIWRKGLPCKTKFKFQKVSPSDRKHLQKLTLLSSLTASNPFLMQVLTPAQISGEIMKLMDEAVERMIIVSPYFNISQWHKLMYRLESLQSRNIAVEIYVRENAHESIDEVQQAGFTPLVIEGLHTKLYLNEHSAIVSSMNLSESSDHHSLDIAVKSENDQEYANLLQYYSRYIAPAGRPQYAVQLHKNWKEILETRIENAVGVSSTMEFTDSSLIINGLNKYEAFISNERRNDLRICGILTSREFAVASKETALFTKTEMKIELKPANQGHYNKVWGTYAGLKSHCIHAPAKHDEPVIVESIVRFISAVELFKKRVG